MSLKEQKIGKPRMMNLELLRCIAMMMVVVLHYLGKGNLLGDLTVSNMGTVGTTAWFLESICIVAVNVYMLISGYFLSDSSFKLSRLLSLLLQVLTYSVIVGLIAAFTGLVPARELTTYYFVQLLFPVSMGHYWFMTAYVFMYLLLPFIDSGVKSFSKKQFQLALFMLLFVFCMMKSILPLRLDMDAMGYDCLWYLCVFLTAAYIRRFGITFLQKNSRGILLYVIAVFLIFGGTMGLHYVYVKTGSLGLLLKICLEYNHVLPFLASVGLFTAFLQWKPKGKIAGAICRMAPYTLGVYLLHENLGLRYVWQKWLGAERITDVWSLLGWTLVAVILVFGAGVLAEAVREKLMKLLNTGLMHVGIYRRLQVKIEAADLLFQNRNVGVEGIKR